MRPTPAKILACLIALLIAAGAAGWPTPAAAATKPNDPYYGRQWGLRRIGATSAWKMAKGKGTVVGVIDTGINYRHLDLKRNLVKGYDFLQNDTDPIDPQGHGTATSGVIGAVTNNKMGVAAVAPSTKIMPLRACSTVGENSCDPDAVTEAIMWAADHGADVINMSLGGLLPWPQTQAGGGRTGRVGVLIVASAGNENTPVCGFPAANPLVLCVGASDHLDHLADFSNYFVRLDVVAPGVGIWSTDRIGSYSQSNGTSLSAPFVAGVGALLMSMGATNVQAAQIIRTSAKDLGYPGYDNTYGFGRLDAKAAVQLCSEIC